MRSRNGDVFVFLFFVIFIHIVFNAIRSSTTFFRASADQDIRIYSYGHLSTIRPVRGRRLVFYSLSSILRIERSSYLRYQTQPATTFFRSGRIRRNSAFQLYRKRSFRDRRVRRFRNRFRRATFGLRKKNFTNITNTFSQRTIDNLPVRRNSLKKQIFYWRINYSFLSSACGLLFPFEYVFRRH